MAPEPRRWLLSFGYDGRGFAGWARQPGRRTVEGVLLDGMRRSGLAASAGEGGLAVASRTDRGVSARANALALTSPLPAPALLRALNGLAPEVFFTEAREVDARFAVRSASWREYHYFEPSAGRAPARWRELLPNLSGKRIDVRSFGRSIPGVQPQWRPIDRVAVVERTGYFRFEIRAPGFVWGMVRKLVSAFRAVERGELPAEEFRSALEGRSRLALPLAEPERLLLWEVDFGLPRGVLAVRPSRGQRRYFGQQLEDSALRAPFLGQLLEGELGLGRL
jgi:tRNA pseudouridine38-40 synthase